MFLLLFSFLSFNSFSRFLRRIFGLRRYRRVLGAKVCSSTNQSTKLRGGREREREKERERTERGEPVRSWHRNVYGSALRPARPIEPEKTTPDHPFGNIMRGEYIRELTLTLPLIDHKAVQWFLLTLDRCLSTEAFEQTLRPSSFSLVLYVRCLQYRSMHLTELQGSETTR